MRRFASLRAVLVATLLAWSCSEPFSPQRDLPASVPFTPPAKFATFWNDVEACSGISADFNRVRWYVIPDVYSFDYRGETFFGYWWSTHDILLAGGRASDPNIVRHEMLHDLLGDVGHPAEYFVTRCGALVG